MPKSPPGMDIERSDAFLPLVNLSEEVEKIALMKAAFRSYIGEHERILHSVQRRLKAGQHQLDICMQESKSVEMKLNIVEMKITETFMRNQEQQTEALQSVKDNRSIKRKIIALKNDIEHQEKILRRASETMTNVVRKNLTLSTSKKLKVIPDIAQ